MTAAEAIDRSRSHDEIVHLLDATAADHDTLLVECEDSTDDGNGNTEYWGPDWRVHASLRAEFHGDASVTLWFDGRWRRVAARDIAGLMLEAMHPEDRARLDEIVHGAGSKIRLDSDQFLSISEAIHKADRHIGADSDFADAKIAAYDALADDGEKIAAPDLADALDAMSKIEHGRLGDDPGARRLRIAVAKALGWQTDDMPDSGARPLVEMLREAV